MNLERSEFPSWRPTAWICVSNYKHKPLTELMGVKLHCGNCSVRFYHGWGIWTLKKFICALIWNSFKSNICIVHVARAWYDSFICIIELHCFTQTIKNTWVSHTSLLTCSHTLHVTHFERFTSSTGTGELRPQSRRQGREVGGALRDSTM